MSKAASGAGSEDADAASTRPVARRSARERQSQGNAGRSRWPLLAVGLGVALVLGAYGYFSFGRPPGGPVAELGVFAAALDSRDVGGMLSIWDPDAQRDDAAAKLTKLFDTLGVAGTTARVEPPRIRRIDDTSCRGIHRMGELDLESQWRWTGEAYRLTGLEIMK